MFRVFGVLFKKTNYRDIKYKSRVTVYLIGQMPSEENVKDAVLIKLDRFLIALSLKVQIFSF